MADYQPLIAKAIAGLDKNTGDARRAVYERARAALVAQLRGVSPALTETDITRERLALEEAIRKVEAESARQAWVEPVRAEPIPKMRRQEFSRGGDEGESPPQLPAPPRQLERAPPPEKPTSASPRRNDVAFDEPLPEEPEPPPHRLGPARNRPDDRRSLLDSGLKDFREVISEANELGEGASRAAQAAREAREVLAAVQPPNRDFEQPASRPPEPRMPAQRTLEASLPATRAPEPRAPEPRAPAPRVPVQQHDEALRELEDFAESRMLESSYALEESRPAPPPPSRQQQMPSYRAERTAQPVPEMDGSDERPGRSFGELAKIAVSLVIVAGIFGILAWRWSDLSWAFQRLLFRSPPVEVAATQEPPPSRPKITDRIEPSGPLSAAPLPGATPTVAPAAAVAQRVLLYEEDPNDLQGRRFVGSAIWRTETVSPGQGLAPELAIRADVEIPERRLTMTWSLRRNTDKQLPASHTVEILFKLPADFPPGGISNVPGLLMKQAEQTRGVPLAGLAVKVTNGFFLIGLSAVDADRERNIQLLKERSWFDIPVVYTNNRRAILAMEKGTPGERAFEEAFRTWRQ